MQWLALLGIASLPQEMLFPASPVAVIASLPLYHLPSPCSAHSALSPPCHAPTADLPSLWVLSSLLLPVGLLQSLEWQSESAWLHMLLDCCLRRPQSMVVLAAACVSMIGLLVYQNVESKEKMYFKQQFSKKFFLYIINKESNKSGYNTKVKRWQILDYGIVYVRADFKPM